MSLEKVVMDQGSVPSLSGVGLQLTRPYKRQCGRRTGLVLLAGGCLGGVLVCAVLMPLVYVTMSDRQLELEVSELRNLVINLSARTALPGTEDRENDTATGGAHRQRRRADPPPSIGDVYVRWGRDDCGENAKTIYSGVVASGFWEYQGGGNDYQCLPLEGVEWNNPVAGNQHQSYIYGTEYSVGAGLFSTDNMGYITNPFDYDVPCSVCLVSGRSTHVMIPARLSCPRGWSMEYSGYLMTAPTYHHNSKNFICMDGAPQLRPGSSANLEGASNLHLVEAQCGSLPCGPYINGYELTCVVCTLM
ncbi:PREDICTED: short-chain collagen C4-like [Branchiostoma belcheri]|uniref:Short-chain collagen C4-like n=1 Tax=Branchiostoma belcheri TaxID=7741 RepID=A0A6P4YRX8_BRABE|nr:PREDICTED: short-chain collagen C4-like [Branchiostoma belcheri]